MNKITKRAKIERINLALSRHDGREIKLTSRVIRKISPVDLERAFLFSNYYLDYKYQDGEYTTAAQQREYDYREILRALETVNYPEILS